MRLLQGPPTIFWPLKEVNGYGGDEVSWDFKTKFRVPLWQPSGEDRGKRRVKKDRGKGEGAPTVPFLQAALSFLPFSLSPLKTPMSESAQVDGQGRNCHRHLGAHQEEKPKGGKKAGGREQGREAAGGRRREGGEREGRRRDA